MFSHTKMNVFGLSYRIEPYLISWADFQTSPGSELLCEFSVNGNSLFGPGFTERLRTNLMVLAAVLCFHLTLESLQ